MTEGIFGKDDFLSVEDFDKLNKTMLARYTRILKQDRWAALNPSIPVNNRETIKDPVDISILLGPNVPDIVEKIRNYAITEAGLENLELGAVWFVYMTPDKEVHTHTDKGIKGLSSDPSKCYRIGIYGHAVWDDDWGGEWVSSGEKYTAKPNKLLGWRGDIPHGVAPILHKNSEYLRMLMVTSWAVV